MKMNIAHSTPSSKKPAFHVPYNVNRAMSEQVSNLTHQLEEKAMQKRFRAQKSYGGKGWGGI